MAWIFILLFSQYSEAWHRGEAHCSARDLARKDCHMHVRPYDVQVTKTKITWSDGTWTSIADSPMASDEMQWDKVTVNKMGQRWILQCWVWDAGKGEPKAQSLHWIVGELDAHKYSPRIDQVLRKRVTRTSKPGTYTYDRWVPHSLGPTANIIKWTAGRQSGSF
jgi:hypothetical protein